MGYGLGAAIGAKMGNPDKVVINVAGDGCFRMNMNELATATRNNMALVEVIINNQVLGMVRQWQTLYYEKRYSNTILQDKVDYVKLAEAMGAVGMRVTKKEDLAEAIRKVYHGTAMINEDIASKVVKLFSKMVQSNLAIQVDETQTADLKPAEWRIITLVGRGMSNKEIAGKLGLSDGSVRNSLSTILSKLNLRDRTQLAIWAVQTGAVNRDLEE